MQATNQTSHQGWKFSKAFWVANSVELLERAAYYGVFIVITLYLSRILGFSDVQGATIAGVFQVFYTYYLLLQVDYQTR
jgi:dipeptide/tripeptide permease